MPDAMAAAASPCIAASDSSAITVTAPLAALSLPAVTPPNLRKSFSLISAALPVPTTIRRSALIPAGAGSRPQRLACSCAEFQLIVAKHHENAARRCGKRDKADLDGVGHG